MHIIPWSRVPCRLFDSIKELINNFEKSLQGSSSKSQLKDLLREMQNMLSKYGIGDPVIPGDQNFTLSPLTQLSKKKSDIYFALYY